MNQNLFESRLTAAAAGSVAEFINQMLKEGATLSAAFTPTSSLTWREAIELDAAVKIGNTADEINNDAIANGTVCNYFDYDLMHYHAERAVETVIKERLFEKGLKVAAHAWHDLLLGEIWCRDLALKAIKEENNLLGAEMLEAEMLQIAKEAAAECRFVH